MMRSLFIVSALLFSALLSGCGFTPVHGASGVAAPLANIDIQLERGSNVVTNQAGFFVLQRLRDRTGIAPDTAPYRLEITPRYTRTRFGLTDADIASRYDVTVGTNWKLVNTKNGNVMKRGNTTTKTTFGAPEGPFGVITADNVGVEQAASETADKLILELAKFFASRNKK